MQFHCTECAHLRKEIEDLRKRLLIQEKLVGMLHEKEISTLVFMSEKGGDSWRRKNQKRILIFKL